VRNRNAARAAATPSTPFIAGVVGGLAVWNNVVHPLVPGSEGGVYIPLNLAAAGALLAASAREGLTVEALGLAPERSPAGLWLGAKVAVAIAGGLALAVAVPRFRPFLRDERIRGLDPDAVAERMLFRIPLGTVVLEEVAFRGVLYGALRERWGPVAAAVGSSAIFGLWHVRPTLQTLDTNGRAVAPGRRVAAVAAAVGTTAAAGLLFCWLQERSGSLLAPGLVHVATNSLGTLASAMVHRLEG
jgi:membrane protease YdiL (CAAX protease family)